MSIHPDSMALPEAGSVKDWFLKGKWQLDSRSYFSLTHFARSTFKSDYTLAAGIGGGFVSAPVRYTGLGFSAYAHTSAFGTDVLAPDTTTGLQNRYEIGLYDMYNLKTKGLFRAEELYLYHHRPSLRIRAGRMLLQTPLVNGQDGRMRASLVQGIYGQWKLNQHWEFQGGWLNGFSPRGTTNWFDRAASVGVYAVGLNTAGKKSGYAAQVSSPGMAVAALTFKTSGWKTTGWNYSLLNVFNTALIQTERQWDSHWMTGLILIRQDKLGNGGNYNPANQYFEQAGSWSGSGRVEYQRAPGKWKINLNYTRITRHGRYLFPREWGRDPFYTFLSRERNEGMADLHAVTINGAGMMKPLGILWTAGAGYVDAPSVFHLPNQNKYAQPAYWQLNLTARKNNFSKIPGLDIFVLLLTKVQAIDGELPLKYEFNRLNYVHMNIVINYKISNIK